MFIAGEASGDQLAAELVQELRSRIPGAVFFGAGAAKMAGAGVELVFDMTQLAVVGFTDVFRNVFKLSKAKNQLVAEAARRKPDVIIGVDYGEFNSRFARAIRQELTRHPGSWRPEIVKFISPQVWASRPGRARALAEDFDLLLSIFPFEKDWFARRAPTLRVEFVGHPMIDRFGELPNPAGAKGRSSNEPGILLLPGSRRSEIKNHLPAMLGALKLIRSKIPGATARIILPNQSLADLARSLGADIDIQIGNLPGALAESDLAISKTGTVTMECAFFGLPAVTLYKGSWLNYQIARHFITVKSFTMVNLLAGKMVYPEFLQNELTPENLARAALDLLQNESSRIEMKSELDRIVASLGGPGATRRAADAVLSLFP